MLRLLFFFDAKGDYIMSVERDALRFMEAKLDYGKGAGTKRKLINAELEQKFKDPGYKEAFNDALLNIDTDRILKKIEKRKEYENTYRGIKKTYRNTKRAVSFTAKYKDAIIWFLNFFFGGDKK